MARTSAKAKKSKQEVLKGKAEAANDKPEDKDNHDTTKDADDDAADKENGEPSYEVEKIVHSRTYRGKKQYLVRWKGYGEESDTWENESELDSCPEVLEAFKKENATSNGEENAEGEKKAKKGAKVTKNKIAPSKAKKDETVEDKKDTESEDDKSEEEKDDKSEEESDDSKEKTKSKKRSKGAKKVPAKKAKVEASSTKKEVKNKKSKDSDDESVTDGKDYEVEKILEMHTKRDGSREFLIRWKGYRPSEDTWEPEAHLDCSELIEKFMEKVSKAKSIPARELRESRAPKERFEMVNTNSRTGRSNLRRNLGVRPSYAESVYVE